MKTKFFGRFVAASLIFASLVGVFIQQPTFAGPEPHEGHRPFRPSSPGSTLKEGLEAEANRAEAEGKDADAARLRAMAGRLNEGNISEPEASDIAREVAVGNFGKAASLVDRGSRD
jgi:hypothetical protein